MKITPDDYQSLSDAVAPIMRRHHNIGWTERARWDALWASKFPVNTLYHYLNDDHVDTALRRISRDVKNGARDGE